MTLKGWKLPAASAALLICVSGVPSLAQTDSQTVQPAQPVSAASIVKTDSSPADAATKAPQSSVASLNTPLDVPIGPGDLIEVSVFGVKDFDQEFRVSASGDINFPLIGPVRVSVLTQDQAQELIEHKLRDGGFMLNPHVSIFTKEYATQGVSVLGEVTHPGVYPLLGPRRLFDVISLAGGLTNRAGNVVTIAHRDDPDNVTTLQLNGDPAKMAETNVPVKPGDTLGVSKAGIVYVVGDVARPAGFVMENDKLTVLQAVALAGGTNGTASLNSSKIIRKTPGGIQEIPMPLKEILSAKAEDVALLPGDVLFVPKSAAKSGVRRSAEAILQITTGVAIYRR